MAFPHCDRVIYRKNPLDRVVCQLKFPKILKLESEVPGKYQEAIRKLYPLFESKSLSEEFPIEISSLAGIGGINSRSYEFSDSNEEKVVVLTSDSLSFYHFKYEKWETFKQELILILEPFEKIYEPPFYTRVSLRHVNVIERSKLGLTDYSWSKLLQPHVAGELSSSDINSENIQSIFSQVIIKLDDNIKVGIQHGFVKSLESEEVCYLIDSTLFKEERVSTDETITTLDQFNKQSGRLFRRCITETLHNKMEPNPL